MKSLRTQLLSSHLALAALMAVVMLAAVFNFFRLGRSIDRILKDNYQSVRAAQSMKESLERQDSACTFFLAGDVDKAIDQYLKNKSVFLTAYKIEAGNITEAGEQQISNDIQKGYALYQKNLETLLYNMPAGNTERGQSYYLNTLEPGFTALKKSVNEVLDINQAAILRADQRAKNEARQASWFGVAMTVAALMLAVVFARSAINSALTPLMALAQGAEEVGAGHLNRRIEFHRSDEIGVLARAFNHMAEKLREARQIEEQRLHRAEKMSDAALQSLYDPVLVTDAAGIVVHLNRAAESLFGTAAQLMGLPIAQAVREQNIIEAIEQTLKSKDFAPEAGKENLVALPVDDKEHIYRLRATPMQENDDTLLGAALVLEDITHLHELDRLKTEFIGVASHELRTPVTSLLLSAQLLQEGSAGPLTELQQEIVKAQSEDLQRLEKLMRDLLDLTRLEAGVGSPHFEIVAPEVLVKRAAEAVATEAGEKKLVLKKCVAPGLPAIRCDEAQIVRVLVNLLNNAIRHTAEGGEIAIEVRHRQNFVHFSIVDNGEGIAPDYLTHVFDRFVQVPGSTRGGAGLGLSIAQTIVQAHGGTISAKSELGQGSRFDFTVPVEQAK